MSIAELKTECSSAIAKQIKRRKLTQVEAGEIMGTDSCKVSNIVCGRLKGFSLERLLRFCVLLGLDVAVVTKQRKTKQ